MALDAPLPVAVIYGERLVATAIAAEGDRVAVAYEEPNGTRQQVGRGAVADAGAHLRVARTASREIDAATRPAVALAGQRLAVSWMTRRMADLARARDAAVGSRRRRIR